MPLCFFDGVWMCVHACTCSMFNCVQASLLQGHADIPDFKFKIFQFASVWVPCVNSDFIQSQCIIVLPPKLKFCLTTTSARSVLFHSCSGEKG